MRYAVIAHGYTCQIEKNVVFTDNKMINHYESYVNILMIILMPEKFIMGAFSHTIGAADPPAFRLLTGACLKQGYL